MLTIMQESSKEEFKPFLYMYYYMYKNGLNCFACISKALNILNTL